MAIYTEPAAASGKYKSKKFIIEGAKEMQDWAGFLPATDDLPTTHEHFVTHSIEDRNGHPLTIVEVGVREKKIATSRPEPDELNAMDDKELETESVRRGVIDYPKGASKAKRVAAIRAHKPNGLSE